MLSTNVFRLKDFLTIRILGEKDEVIIPAGDLKPDRYEYGIPVISKSKKPKWLSYDLDNYAECNEILEKLASNIEEDEETSDETDEVMYELEKIISGSQSKTDDEDDDDEMDVPEEQDDDDYEYDEDDSEDEELEEDEEEPVEEDEEPEEEEDDLDETVVQQTLF